MQKKGLLILLLLLTMFFDNKCFYGRLVNFLRIAIPIIKNFYTLKKEITFLNKIRFVCEYYTKRNENLKKLFLLSILFNFTKLDFKILKTENIKKIHINIIYCIAFHVIEGFFSFIYLKKNNHLPLYRNPDGTSYLLQDLSFFLKEKSEEAPQKNYQKNISKSLIKTNKKFSIEEKARDDSAPQDQLLHRKVMHWISEHWQARIEKEKKILVQEFDKTIKSKEEEYNYLLEKKKKQYEELLNKNNTTIKEMEATQIEKKREIETIKEEHLHMTRQIEEKFAKEKALLLTAYDNNITSEKQELFKLLENKAKEYNQEKNAFARKIEDLIHNNNLTKKQMETTQIKLLDITEKLEEKQRLEAIHHEPKKPIETQHRHLLEEKNKINFLIMMSTVNRNKTIKFKQEKLEKEWKKSQKKFTLQNISSNEITDWKEIDTTEEKRIERINYDISSFQPMRAHL